MLPRHKYLLTYRYAEIIHDLTVDFCRIHLERYKDRRTIEQMVSAARSGKQNIVEGVGQSKISKKGEIKLLNVANASLEELLSDYEDFLRQRKLGIWPKSDPRVGRLRTISFRLSHLSNLSDLGEFREKAVLPVHPEEAANMMLTLCHQATYLLSKQIAALDKKFIEEGGYTENLFKRRMTYRGNKLK